MKATLTSASGTGAELYDWLYTASAFIFGLLMIVLALERTSVRLSSETIQKLLAYK